MGGEKQVLIAWAFLSPDKLGKLFGAFWWP